MTRPALGRVSAVGAHSGSASKDEIRLPLDKAINNKGIPARRRGVPVMSPIVPGNANTSPVPSNVQTQPEIRRFQTRASPAISRAGAPVLQHLRIVSSVGFKGWKLDRGSRLSSSAGRALDL